MSKSQSHAVVISHVFKTLHDTASPYLSDECQLPDINRRHATH